MPNPKSGHLTMSACHVVPVDDLIKHDSTTDGADCVCGPEAKPIERDDGSMGFVIVHYALDGRELREAASRDG